MLWGRVLDPQNLGYSASLTLLRLMFEGDAAATAWAPARESLFSMLLHPAS